MTWGVVVFLCVAMVVFFGGIILMCFKWAR